MYEQFFGLRERPFELTPNPAFLVMTDTHREALCNLEYGITSRKGITLLIGEAGTGKTTLIRAALGKQDASVFPVVLNNPTLSRAEFLQMLAAEFCLSKEAATSKAVFLAELEQKLRARQTADETTVLVIDEAQSLPTDILEEIRLLVNMETDERKLLSVILAGQPELGPRLDQPHLRQLKQRIALRCELRVLTLPETAAYLAARIRAAGGVGSNILTREAVTLIHEHSGGIPRTICVIADNALLGGFAAAERPVSSRLVREVCRDFHYFVSRNAEPAVEPPPVEQPRPVDGKLLTMQRVSDVTATSMPPVPIDTPEETAATKTKWRRGFSLFGS